MQFSPLGRRYQHLHVPAPRAVDFGMGQCRIARMALYSSCSLRAFSRPAGTLDSTMDRRLAGPQGVWLTSDHSSTLPETRCPRAAPPHLGGRRASSLSALSRPINALITLPDCMPARALSQPTEMLRPGPCLRSRRRHSATSDRAQTENQATLERDRRRCRRYRTNPHPRRRPTGDCGHHRPTTYLLRQAPPAPPSARTHTSWTGCSSTQTRSTLPPCSTQTTSSTLPMSFGSLLSSFSAPPSPPTPPLWNLAIRIWWCPVARIRANSTILLPLVAATTLLGDLRQGERCGMVTDWCPSSVTTSQAPPTPYAPYTTPSAMSLR
uniref:Uncharacterized protein n=1 Tax=Mycena chlorophos TaxID=658473 RepID=A0ABQ0L3A2_MYCCL|nr:predicted protein [Mycena chlorophos]